MTATVPPALHDQDPPEVTRGSSVMKRFREWFWLSDALRRVKAGAARPSERATQLAARARSRAEIARQVVRMEMRPEDQTQASANELLRNSVYAALRSLATRPNESEGVAYSAAVWDTLHDVLPQLNYRKPLSPALEASLREGSLLYFAELPAKEQVELGSELNALAEALLQRTEFLERGTTEIYLARFWHSAALATLLCVLLFGGAWFYRLHSDVAAGKPWRASSTLAGAAVCTSPAQECDQLLGAFFHTNEELNPWLEIDLGAPLSISKAELENRADCCSDRAHPIVIEVSTDHAHWKTMARYDEDFVTWKAAFPAVTARWVRVRVLRTSYLHLKRVRVF